MLNDIEEFDSFISDSFTDGKQSREFRLSKQELAYVKNKFPNTRIKEIFNNNDLSDKKWYKVSIKNSNTNK